MTSDDPAIPKKNHHEKNCQKLSKFAKTQNCIVIITKANCEEITTKHKKSQSKNCHTYY